jgi:hypothetical protein
VENDLYDQLILKTEELRDLLRKSSTESIVGMCAAFSFRRLVSGKDGQKLISPGRQPNFLLGLMLSTDEPERPDQFGKEDWDTAENLLNDIFSTYAWMFWPKPEEVGSLTESWKQAREVAMPAFLHYFNTGLLASVEQVQDRIKRYLCPFDVEIKSLMGISASEALTIANFIMKDLQHALDKVVKCSINSDFRTGF